MKILSLDSSATVATVALCEDEALLAEFTLNNGNTHSETLLPMVETLLATYGMTVGDVELFACTSGPGSFTGVRIGAATVKGLAFGRDIPCVGVSTPEAIAENLVSLKGLICPVMNARRKQVYTALFREKDGNLERLMPDSAISIAELDKLLDDYNEPVYLVGDGYDITLQNLSHPVGDTPQRLRYQSAASVAKAACLAYRSGSYSSDGEISPIYLRPCQAERERLEKESMKKEDMNNEAN